MPSRRSASASSTVATPSSAAPAASAARPTSVGAVAVPVGLDDHHHLGRSGVLTQQPHVVRDGVEVHHGLGGRV
ncbi:hypothetical protein ACVWWN_007203 [Mycobacterium sp. URHB0021]